MGKGICPLPKPPGFGRGKKCERSEHRRGFRESGGASFASELQPDLPHATVSLMGGSNKGVASGESDLEVRWV